MEKQNVVHLHMEYFSTVKKKMRGHEGKEWEEKREGKLWLGCKINKLIYFLR